MSKKKNRPLPESLALPMAGIDTHAHLDIEQFANVDLDKLLYTARQAGIAKIGNVFLSTKAYDAGRERLGHYPELFFLLATHPNDSSAFDTLEKERMRQRFCTDERLKAVGETGLDYYWDDCPRTKQQHAFCLQLELARELDLPVVIHSREAEEDTLAILMEQGFSQRPVLWHCFGGDQKLADTILEQGWHISIPGPVSYAKNTELHQAVVNIPLERLVLETDCPYLAPEPWRGKQNHPALMVFTAMKIAQLKGISTEEVWLKSAETATQFFRL